MRKYTCTHCSYIYNPFIWEEDTDPGIPFDDLNEWWTCPHCGEWKEEFIETPENIQEISSGRSATEQEASHVPFYREEGNNIIVQIGTDDSPHEIEENHFIEYVGLFEIDGTVIDMKLQPEESSIVFENPELDEYEVRLSCNVHGVWRGIHVGSKNI